MAEDRRGRERAAIDGPDAAVAVVVRQALGDEDGAPEGEAAELRQLDPLIEQLRPSDETVGGPRRPRRER